MDDDGIVELRRIATATEQIAVLLAALLADDEAPGFDLDGNPLPPDRNESEEL